MDKDKEKLLTLDGLDTIKLGIGKMIIEQETTYTLEEDTSDGYKIIFTPSSGTPTVLTPPNISISSNNNYEELES